ncbi:MAG: TRL domain-containing protein [Leptospiraceae bacterium]|nr:TRL domain-containing protein [Leptospiraceae bacterium]
MYNKFIILFTITLGLLSNCINSGYTNGLGPEGLLYSNYKIGLSGNNNPTVIYSKVGRACVTRYLFLMTFGEAGVYEAATEGQVKDIKSIDREVLNILSIYTEACTVVRGN